MRILIVGGGVLISAMLLGKLQVALPGHEVDLVQPSKHVLTAETMMVRSGDFPVNHDRLPPLEVGPDHYVKHALHALSSTPTVTHRVRAGTAAHPLVKGTRLGC